MRTIAVGAAGAPVSVLIAAPSSAEPESHAADLPTYRSMGGSALHLHGEGGEVHSRIAAGEWINANGLRDDTFLCVQICHDDWDEELQRPIDRFNATAVSQDVDSNAALIGVEHVDMVYLPGRRSGDFREVIDAVQREIASGRVGSFGLSSWTPEYVRAVMDYCRSRGGAPLSGILTTELSLLRQTAPLWPEYLQFDAMLANTVVDLSLSVFAHAGDLTIGQCLFGDADKMASFRPHWVSRWNRAQNNALMMRMLELAETRCTTTRAISIGWMLAQRFPCAAIVGLPALCGAFSEQYIAAANLNLTVDEVEFLIG